MKIQNEQGIIQIDNDVFTTITGAVATSCFGVKGMAARSKKDGTEDSAIDIVKKRYAKGEITKEEFEKMKDDLTKT